MSWARDCATGKETTIAYLLKCNRWIRYEIPWRGQGDSEGKIEFVQTEVEAFEAWIGNQSRYKNEERGISEEE